MRKVVANTTPLIALADIGQLELLHQLYDEILIPDAVMSEIESGPARTQVTNAQWIIKRSINSPERKSLFKSRLHSGEVEVIILAEDEKADLIIMDDNTAKKTAKYLGLNVTGTLGILLRAKREGKVKEVRPLIDKLIDEGLYIDEQTKQTVLKNAGE